MKKSELLNWLQEEYQQWGALLEKIRPERMEQPGVNGDWSMKDIVVHLTGWNHWLVLRIQAAGRGEPEPPPPHLHCTERGAVQGWPAHLQEEDEVNAWIYESHRGRSVQEALDEAREVFQQLLAVIEDLPDDVRIEAVYQGERVFHHIWLGDQRFPAGQFFDHFYDDHEPDVRAWLARVET
jgi:hypothetical protein